MKKSSRRQIPSSSSKSSLSSLSSYHLCAFLLLISIYFEGVFSDSFVVDEPVVVVYGSAPQYQKENFKANNPVADSAFVTQAKENPGFDIGAVHTYTIKKDEGRSDEVTPFAVLDASIKDVPSTNYLPNMITKKVKGFIDFTTTIGNTVMIFTTLNNASSSVEKSKSNLRLESVRIKPSQSHWHNSDFASNFEIEELFNNYQDHDEALSQDPVSTRLKIQSSNFDVKLIKPSAVHGKKRPFEQSVTQLANGLVEDDNAVDEARFDLVSVQPTFGIDEDSFNVRDVTAAKTANIKTLTKIDSTTIHSDFFTTNVNGGTDANILTPTGLITQTEGTLIDSGITTIHNVKVFGTVLDGNYAQVLQSTSKIFKQNIKATTATGFRGAVVHVTDRPSHNVEDFGVKNEIHDNLPLAALFNEQKTNLGNNINLTDSKQVPKKDFMGRQNNNRKLAAIDAFKSRLKKRFQKFKSSNKKEQDKKNKLKNVQTSHKTLSTETAREGRRLRKKTSTKAPPSTRQRTPRRFVDLGRSRGFETSSTTSEPPERFSSTNQERSFSRKNSEFKSSNRNRGRRRRPNNQQIRNKSPAFANRRISHQDSLTIHKSNVNIDKPIKTTTQSSSRSSPKIHFKKFDRFKRPKPPKTLFQKLLDKKKNKNKSKNTKSVVATSVVPFLTSSKNSATFKHEPIKSTIVSKENNVHDGTTTLSVSTYFPVKGGRKFEKIATIRSPYSFLFEETMSTRYITVTRTFSGSITTTSISPSKTVPPIFKTETIPAPENILTSSIQDLGLIIDSSEPFNHDLLPAVTLTLSSSLKISTPPLKVITESFSTKELMLKTSILPIVVDHSTELRTLTQSYYITRLVEAIRTVPPMGPYEFIATKAFKDINNSLDEAGSEHNLQLLPGELQFGDEDNDFNDGPHEVKIRPPPGFLDELKLVGSKFDPVASIESGLNVHEHEKVDSKESSNINSFQNLNVNPLAGLSFDQIKQLAMLQYFQNAFGNVRGRLPNFGNIGNVIPNFGNVGGGLPNFGNIGGGLSNFESSEQSGIVTTPKIESSIDTKKPSIVTETLYKTTTIPLMMGNKKMVTTISRSVGERQITGDPNSFPSSFSSPSTPLISSSDTFSNPLFLQPSYEVETVTFVKDTVSTSTFTTNVKITFRNVPSAIKITSTSLITSQVTLYTTKTVKVEPSINPLAGFFLG